MNTQFTAYKSMDDLVFENRNIGYGAYILRKDYSKHLFSAVIISLGCLSLALIAPTFFKVNETVNETIKKRKTTVLEEPPVLIIPIMPPPANVTPPPAPNSNFTPIVTDSENDDQVFINADLALPDFSIPASGEGVAFDNSLSYTPEIDAGLSVAKVDTFIIVDQMPELDDLAKFLQKNLKYPEAAIKQELEGKVYLSFVIGTDGGIGNIKVLKGVSKELDEEAIRVVKKMPNWKPGKQNGRAVPVRFSLPVVFQLQK